jgi:uncharacterized RDD family membrane protein YckC
MSNELLDDLSRLDVLEEESIEQISVGALFRLTAFFFDFIALVMLSVILTTFMTILGLMIPEAINTLINQVLVTSLYLLYYPVLESSRLQASVGKFVVSIKVVDKKGEQLTFMKALGRFCATIMACILFFIGIIMIALTDKRGMHDMMTDTYVVKNEKR